MTPEAEKFNGWMAMIGFVAATGAYITTGQIIPGIFKWEIKEPMISFGDQTEQLLWYSFGLE